MQYSYSLKFTVSSLEFRVQISKVCFSIMRLAAPTWKLGTQNSKLFSFVLQRPDAHFVERPPNEKSGNHEENQRQYMSDHGTILALVRNRYRQLNCQQPKQRRELNDRIQSHRRSVLVGIADGVSYDGCVMQWSALLFQF